MKVEIKRSVIQHLAANGNGNGNGIVELYTIHILL